MSSIKDNLQGVTTAIDRARDTAIAAASRPVREAVALVAVSKTKSADEVRMAFAAGQRSFGENYVQEAVQKITALSDLRASGIAWHFIGPIQSNKTRLLAQHFDWVQGVERVKIAEALSRQRQELGGAPLNVCLQINISGEVSKSGIPPADAAALAKLVAALPGLRLRGLMTIIENTPDESVLRGQFRAMRRLFDALAESHAQLDTLSMGMSQDFALAIAEGSTMVRIGSAIFGARPGVAPSKLPTHKESA